MSEIDDKFLAKMNSGRKPGLPPVTEEEFETIMDLYETHIEQAQPYLSMNVNDILPFEDFESTFDENLDANQKAVAKAIYAHWREQKFISGGKSIVPSLKVPLFRPFPRQPYSSAMQSERDSEKDDGDPYVCFRRREVRQVRKTRRTDAQSTDKLKKIRQEFETARGLVKDVLQREVMRRISFQLEKQIFEQRRTAIELKRKLNIKDTDEDLINKVCPLVVSRRYDSSHALSPSGGKRNPRPRQRSGYLSDKTGNPQMRISSSCRRCVQRTRRNVGKDTSCFGGRAIFQSILWWI